MDQHDDHGGDEVPEAPVTERVRIIGAEPAGMAVGGIAPTEPESPAAEPESPAAAPAPELPHWADPPTGQVPAVLARHHDPDQVGIFGAGDDGPSWREHDHEWDDSFQPALLANDETRVGALEDSPLEDRRPWEFDAEPAAEAPADDPVAPTSGHWAAGIDPDPPPPAVTTISSSPLRHRGDSPPVPRRDQVRRRSRRHHDGESGGPERNVPVAIATGVVVAALALICFKLGSLATAVLVTVVVALAAAEAFAALRRSGRHPATLLGLVGTVALMVASYQKGVSAFPLVAALFVAGAMVWYLAGVERGSAVEGVAVTVFGFAWVGVLGSFATLLLAPSQFPHRHGVAFVLGAVVAVVGNDVGALAVGGWLGRHQLAPRISPNKTWEGAIGGAVVGIVLSVLITGHVAPWSAGKAAVLGLVVAVVAPIGDLCESLVKRDLGLKDMGSVLPGHGGVLDRFDAMLFVLPATYYLVRAFNLG